MCWQTQILPSSRESTLLQLRTLGLLWWFARDLPISTPAPRRGAQSQFSPANVRFCSVHLRSLPSSLHCNHAAPEYQHSTPLLIVVLKTVLYKTMRWLPHYHICAPANPTPHHHVFIYFFCEYTISLSLSLSLSLSPGMSFGDGSRLKADFFLF